MTARDIIIRRTGLSDEDAAVYEEIATAKIREYLGMPSDSDVSAYTFQIADIAVLYYQQDTSTRNGLSVLGYQSRSFSEGGVSETVTGADGHAIWETYTAAINDVLLTLGGAEFGVVRFL